MRKLRKLLALALCLAMLGSLALTAQAEEPVVLVSSYDSYTGLQIRYYYNSSGYVIREETNWGDVTEFTLTNKGVPKYATTKDKDGNLLSKSFYDKMGNLTSVQEIDRKGTLQLALQYTNRYDDQDRLILRDCRRVQESSGEREEFTYHKDGSYTRTYTQYYNYGDAEQDHIRYSETFDARGNLIARYQDLEYGQPVEYDYRAVYDGEGRIISENTRSYCAGSMDTHIVTTYAYDEKGSLLTQVTYTQGERDTLATTTVYTYANAYNSAGLLCASIRTTHYFTVGPDGSQNSGTEEGHWYYTYLYDDQGRMTRMNEGNDPIYSQLSYTWTYDKWGNLIQVAQNDTIQESYEYAPLSQAQ